jgi:hypothetical protein
VRRARLNLRTIAAHNAARARRRYFDTVVEFNRRTNLSLVFGLNPESADAANTVVAYAARAAPAGVVHAYSFGNEQTGDASLAAESHHSILLSIAQPSIA